MKVEQRGSCLCGSVRCEIHAHIELIENCHCSMCRKAHGAAFSTNATVPTAALRVTSGAELITEFASSPTRRKCFCSRCGSPLFIRRTNLPEFMVIALAVLDDDAQQGPERHVFVGSKASWHAITDHLPQYQIYPGFEPVDNSAA